MINDEIELEKKIKSSSKKTNKNKKTKKCNWVKQLPIKSKIVDSVSMKNIDI